MAEEVTDEEVLAALPEWAQPLATIRYAGSFWATSAREGLDTEQVLTPGHTEPVCTTYPYAPAPLPAALIAEVLNRAPELCRLLAAARREAAQNRQRLMGFVPQTYGEASQEYGLGVINCPGHEWDNRTSLENATWLIGRLKREVERLEKCS